MSHKFANYAEKYLFNFFSLITGEKLALDSTKHLLHDFIDRVLSLWLNRFQRSYVVDFGPLVTKIAEKCVKS